MKCCKLVEGVAGMGGGEPSCSKLAVRFWKYEPTKEVIRVEAVCSTKIGYCVVGYCEQHKDHHPGAKWVEITEEEAEVILVMKS